MVDVVGGKKAFRAKLIREIAKLSKEPINAKQMQRAVATELRRLEIAGVKLEGTDKKRFLVFLDNEEIARMPREINTAGKAQWAFTHLKRVEDMEEMVSNRWQNRLARVGGGMVKGSQPYIAGLLGAIFQYHAMVKLTEDAQKAMSQETTESRRRMYAGVAAFWGTVADITGQGLQKVSVFVPKVARGLGLLGRGLSIVGRIAGIIGAGVVAYWDGKAGLSAAKEGRAGLAVLYFLSAGVGFGAASLMLYASFFAVAWAGPVAWMLIGLLIAVAVVIEFIKDNKLQEWLKRCLWGKGPDARYIDLKTEMEQFKRAWA